MLRRRRSSRDDSGEYGSYAWKFNQFGVMGAGQMGAGIAQVAASAGYSCVVSDIRSDALMAGAKTVEQSLVKLQAKGVIDNVSEIMDRIHWHADMERLQQCDLVIEAVVEHEGIKKEVLRALDSMLKEDGLLRVIPPLFQLLV